MKSSGNVSASVRQRLLNRARSERRPFSELLQYYAMERFLYRLSRSAHADRFVLKGALMLRDWRSPELRPTMDIDLPGRTSNLEADIISQIRDVLTMDVEADGLAFDADSIGAESSLSRQFDFDGAELAEAVHLTFERRGTALPAEIEAFTGSFVSDKQTQWAAFRQRSGKGWERTTSPLHSERSLPHWPGNSYFQPS